MTTAKIQFWAWCFLFVLWVAGCTVEFKPMNAGQGAGTLPADLVPCVTVTAALTSTTPINAISPITGTVPLTTTPGLTVTLTVTAPPAPPITATVTVTAPPAPPITGTATLTVSPVPPITPTLTVTTTRAPTGTVRPTRPVSATLTPGATITATRTTTATLQPTPIGTRTPGAASTPTATRAPGSAPLPPTPTAAATATPFPTNTAIATATRPALLTPTRSLTTTPAPGTPGATPTSGTPLPTGTPPPANTVYVRSHTSFVQDATRFVVGEIVNGTAGPVYRLRITATFYNNNEQVVATQEGLAYLAQTSPDQRNPFKLQVENAPDDITRYELSLTWDDISVVSYQDLAVISQELRQNDGPLIAGELRNDFTENLGSVVVVISLYDAAGNVVDVYQSTPRATQLAPAEVSPYEVPVRSDPPFTTFLVQAQGKRAIFF